MTEFEINPDAARKRQPHVLVLDQAAQDAALAVVRGFYRRALIRGQRSISGNDMPINHRTWHVAANDRQVLATELTYNEIPHFLWRGRRRKVLLVFGTPAGVLDCDLQSLADAQSQSAADWASQWSKSSSITVRYYASRDTHLPVADLIRLANDRAWRVRGGVAASPRTPEYVLRALLDDPVERVRTKLAWNPSLPPALLSVLAGDPSPMVLWTVAANPATPPDIYSLLARDGNDNVRAGAARNPMAPPGYLSTLATDGCPSVRQNVAGNAGTPHSTLEALAVGPFWHVREAVAANPSTPSKILHQFAKSDVPSERAAVARNPTITGYLIARLIRDEHPDVREATIRNPHCPPHWRALAIVANDLPE